MFARPPDLATARATIVVDGVALEARAGESVAAALLASGRLATRTTPVTGAPRGPWCQMGACFDCLCVIDGEPSRQACLVAVRDGMTVETQAGARGLSPPPPTPGTVPEDVAPEDHVVRQGTVPGVTDIAVIGAGPAGLAAATEAARLGLDVVLLDEQAAPGGQIYRAIEANAASGKKLDPDYAHGAALAAAFRASGARAEFGASVWSVDDQGEIGWSRDGKARLLRARRVVVASGALERPVPIPGWTLPGVMTVGAAQILLKTAKLAPQGKVWIAGQGPLLWLYATQALDAGATLAGILDTSTTRAALAALPHLPMALLAADQLARGLRWRRRVRAAGVPVIRVRDLAALGDGKLARIRFDGREAEADLLLLHEGVTPNVQITRALGLEHVWDSRQRCFRPVVDPFGATSLERILVAGDGAGIAGARAAAIAGRLAALDAARGLGRLDEGARDALAAPLLGERARKLAPRRFLDALFSPPARSLVPADDTIVCRCEEVPASALRDAVALGCLGPNQAKAFTRCGMGPCQGRYCGLTACEIIAAARGVPPAEVGYYRLRPPIKPLTLGELAAIDSGGGVARDE